MAVVLPGDLNGDGAADVVVGAPSSDAGRVYIYFGGSPPDATYDILMNGQTIGDRFGYAVASAGDLNADGHTDIVVGAYQSDATGSNSGRAYVYFGGPGLDAMSDLVLDAEAAGDEFGIAVAGIGDANGDGYDDLVVGARYHRVASAEDGRAYVYFGGPGLDAVPDAVVDGYGGERLGFSVSRFDDVNGDGRAEFVVGAYEATSSTGDTQGGRAYFCSIDAGGALTALPFDAAGARYFSAGLGAGDVNGDGHPDLLVGAPASDANDGRVYVYSGGPGFDTVPDVQIQSPTNYASFGRSVAGGADVNGDGHGDLFVGATYDKGALYVYYGGPSLDAIADVIVQGENSESYGWSIAAEPGSDANGDGEDDVLVGAPAYSRGRADFPMAPCIQLTSPPFLMVSTGEIFELQYTISNCETAPVDLSYTITNTDSWCGPVSGTLSLAPGESAPVVLTCTARDLPGCDVTNTFQLTVMIDGCPEIARTCTSTVTRGHVKPIVGCAPGAVSPPGGGTVALTFTIQNPSASRLTFGYKISDTRGWCPPVQSSVFVDPGSSAQIVRMCTVPAGTSCDVTSIVDFAAYNACTGGNYWDQVTCQTTLGAGPAACATLECPPDTVVTSGEPFERRVRLVNSCTTEATFNYVVADDQGWGPPQTGSVTIPALGTATISASFTAPLGTSCSTMDVLRAAAYHQDCPSRVLSCASLLYVAPSANALLALQLSGPQGESGFGVATAMPGDLNADGHEDFVVGSTTTASEGGAFPGRASVFFGGPAADTTPDVVLAGEAAGDRFGYAVAPAGDLNSDGFPDLAVGAYHFGSSAGRVYVYFGGPGFDAVPDFVTGGLLATEQFGYSVAGAGDVNADGHDDLVVGANSAAAAAVLAGRAYVFFGGPNLGAAPPLVLEGHAVREGLGFSVAGGKDVDGDNRADLLVAGHVYTGDYTGGRVYVYSGGPGLDATADLVLTSTYYPFGVGLAALDVNGDAQSDILAGGTGGSRVEVYFGGPGIDSQSDRTIASSIPGDSFGRSISGGADFDGDGFGDFVVGAPGGLGRVYVYLGGPDTDAECDGAFVAETAGDQFGFSCAATGADLNADGAQDLLVGAYQFPAALAKANAVLPGRAYVYSALYSIPVVVQDWTAAWEEGAVSLGWRLAGMVAGESGFVRVQRSDDAAGPYADRARLSLEEEMQYVDREVEPGRSYWYRLLIESDGGSTALAGPYPVTAAVSPARTALEVPYETPAGVRIAYRVGPEAARVVVDVHDIAGRRVRRFEEGLRGPGPHALDWDGHDGRGVQVARGVYLVRLTAGATSLARKMVLLRP